MKRLMLSLFTIIIFGFSGKLEAAWHIKAEKFLYYFKTGVVISEGQVVIKGEGITIFCPRARYESKTKILTIFGPFKMYSNGDYLEASFAKFNLSNSTGEIKNGHLFLEKNRVHILASLMKSKGEDRYEAYNALITTCKICKQGRCSPSWSFHCKKLQISSTGKAKAYHTTFNVRGLPLIYTPYVSLVLKKERKTGFLIPHFVQSLREGFGIELPFYWTINDSFDFTFYPHYTTKRGIIAGIETRYALSENSKGIIRFQYLKDRLKDNDYNQDGIIRENQNRYWITAKIDQEFNNSYDLHLDIDWLSDKDFLFEFDSGDLGFTQSHRTYLQKFGRGLEEKNLDYRINTLWINHAFDHYFFQISTSYYDSQIPGKQPFLLMPIFHTYISNLRTPIWKFVHFSWQNSYTYWWREREYRGHRFETSPQISLNPKVLYFLDLDFSSRLRYTMYWIDWCDELKKEMLDRLIYEIEGRSSLTFYRIYKKSNISFRHTIQPNIEYFYRPYVNQENIPIFMDKDRLPAINSIRYGILQFITAKKEKNNQSKYFDIARFWIYQNYNFDEKDRQRLSDLFLDTEWHIFSSFYLRLNASYNFYGLGLSGTNLTFNLKNSKEEYIGLDYRWDKERKVEQINIRMRRYLFKGIYTSFGIRHSLERHETVEARFGLSYKSQCWYADFMVMTNPDETQFAFFINLLGIGGFGRTFGFSGVN